MVTSICLLKHSYWHSLNMNKVISEKKFQTVECSRCGTCCTEPVVPVTDSDVLRLCETLGTSAEKLVRFYSISEMEFSPDADVWIKFRSGKKAMGLKKKNGKCMFLEKTGCRVYAHRPMTCRTFPYMIDFDDDENPSRVRLNRIVNCKYKKKSPSALEQACRDAQIETAEDFAYYDKIDEWNVSQKNGTTSAFLEFIGLK